MLQGSMHGMETTSSNIYQHHAARIYARYGDHKFQYLSTPCCKDLCTVWRPQVPISINTMLQGSMHGMETTSSNIYQHHAARIYARYGDHKFQYLSTPCCKDLCTVWRPQVPISINTMLQGSMHGMETTSSNIYQHHAARIYARYGDHKFQYLSTPCCKDLCTVWRPQVPISINSLRPISDLFSLKI